MTQRNKSLSIKDKSQIQQQKTFLGRNQPLEVIPAQVVFKDIEINQFYQITVEIRNLTNRATRIRFQKIQNPKIQIIYSMQPEIAPGLSMTAKVKYECNELKNETQIIKIVNEQGYIVELPVRVYKMQSQILFQPFINMGFIKSGKQHSQIIAIKNSGKAPGTIEFNHTHSPSLTVEPKILKIAPKEQSKIIVKYKSNEVGLFKGVIKLKSDAILIKDQIDVHATVIDYARFVVDTQGNQTSQFDFGTMYVGQQVKIKAFIVNNSPNPMKFKTFFRKGYLTTNQQFTILQTPSQIGIEQSERVIFCNPENGEVSAFSEIPIEWICRTRLTYKDKVYTNAFALTSTQAQGAVNQKKNSNQFKPQNVYDYSVMIQSQGDQPIIMQLKATSMCPQIKLSNNLFKFGDCPCQQSIDIKFQVQNKSPTSSCQISFPKIPNFSVIPQTLILKPNKSHQFSLIFQPKTIGKVDTQQILLINKLYQIQLRCFGISTSSNLKKSTDRFTIQKQSPNQKRGKAFSLTDKNFSITQHQMKKLHLNNLHEHKDKYNKYLIEKRTDRANQKKQTAIQKKWSLYQTKLKDLGHVKLDDQLDDEGLSSNPPIDYQFETGMLDTKLQKQFIAIPASKQKLFVTRHIGQYQPQIVKSGKQKYTPDPLVGPKKVWPQVPQNYNHRRQVASELGSSQLQQIQVGSNIINFDQVYIKSKSLRYFWLKNNTKKAIQVKLMIKDHQLDKSYKKPQIVQSGHQAGFQISLYKDTLGDFRSSLKYIINNIHEFELTVTAKCVPVSIEVDKTNLKFQFDDGSLDMFKQEIINLYNPGNSNAFFKFTVGKQKIFVPQIMEQTLKPKQRLSIPIKFTVPSPNAQKNQYNYSQKIVMKILDGSELLINCSCTLPNPKFTIKAPNIAAPLLCVGHQFEDVIEVKNNSKFPIVLYITGKVFEIQEKAKLNPQQVKKFKVKYTAKIAGIFEGEIIFSARGGKPKSSISKITCIEPNIKFSKNSLDLGILVVNGVSGKTNFTLKNVTLIDLPLIIDLRPKSIKPQNPQFVQNINVKLINDDTQLEVISPAQKTDPQEFQRVQGGLNLVGAQVNQDQLQGSQSDQEAIVQKNQDQFRKFRLVLKPQIEYNFEVEFFPREAGNYALSIPMMIQGSKKIDSPKIVCEGIKPQFLFEPTVLDFKRKIVTRPDRCYPKYLNVKIRNLDDEEVVWQIHDQQIKKDGIFIFEQTSGRIKPSQMLQFRVSFNPYAVGDFLHRLPLYIKNSKLDKALKCVDVAVKGSASLPRLYFNKRQVILPVVPLGIQTNSSFKIINDGYQNTNLKCQFLDDVAGINVKVVFPEGPNIGITRQKLKVDLVWKYNKPISFCLKLQFTDDLNRTFTIPVSGTTDNCIFTNYTYFLRNQNKFIIKTSPHLELVQTIQQTGTLVRKNSARSLRSNVTGKSVMSYLGVAPISPSILSNTIDYINRYLNSNLLTIPIQDFPGSFIENDGLQLFQILSFVSSKPSNYPWKYSASQNQKSATKVSKLYNQYNEFIKILKTEGAQLNHIRPQYLLSYGDLNIYLGSLPQQKSYCYMPSLLKINTGLYNYLSMQAWITLLYQILKIYVLGRVTPKNFVSHLGTVNDIPKYYLQGSNFSSSHQNILFFWVQQAILETLLEERRLTNFDKDFKDGIGIAALIQKYSNFPVLKKMKMICTLQEDYKENAVIVCDSLREIGLLNHVTAKDIYNPLQRQMLLLILHLYVYLPFYTPKQQPVIFKCVLGQQVIRSIELSNPSSKPVTYTVRYQGSQDFQLISQSKFRIEPKQTYKFQVKFVSRISSSVTGRIMFINVKENTLTAAALVFELKSEIVGRVSDRIWNVSGILYQQVQFTIEVANKFLTAEMVDFSVTYQTQYIFESKPKQKSTTVPLQKADQIQVIYGKQDNIKIRKNGTNSFILNYVPTSLYTTKTTILFVNPIIGQFQHEVIAAVQPPAIISEIRPPMTLSVDQIVNWQFAINPKNEMMSKAKKIIQGLKKNKKGVASKDQKQTTKPPQVLLHQNFKVQIPPNPYISGKDEILVSQKKQDKKKDNISELVQNENKIPFTIVCKNPVYQFLTYVLVTNKSKTDVRRYRVIFTVQPKPLKAVLEMSVPARSQVTQNLPIVNNTERDWNIKILWQPDSSKNGNYFQINPQYGTSFPVKRNSVGNFPLTFKPKWVNRAQAKLTMNNPLTLDFFQYDIIGVGEQPLAQEHIDIKCQAKQIVKKQIIVKNPYTEKPIVFNVETDLLNWKGNSKLTVASGSKQKYQFTVQPMLCGEYTGSITFSEEDGPQYVWYTVSIVTNYPQAYKTIQMTAQIRQTKVQELIVPMKVTQSTNFQVIINGEGLFGDPTYTIQPNKIVPFKLRFLPLTIGEQKGSVCFINPQVGQTLYQLNLKCYGKPPIVINNLKSPLGVSTSVFAQLFNPINSKVFIKVINTNPQQFVLKNNSFKMDPLQKKSVQIQYIPASLDNLQSTNIKFTSKQIGDWTYQLTGTGQQPVPYQPYVVYNGIYQEHSDSIKFRNPFKYPIVVGVKLTGVSQENIFKLLNHGKDRFEIDSFGILQIPFSFIPTACKLYQAKILVMISQKIYWTFPLKGITQVNKGTVIVNLSTQCRQTTAQSIQVPLQGVQNFSQNNSYKYLLENVPTHYQRLCEKYLLIETIKDKLSHAKDTLEFQFIFKPMKPGKVSFDFLISRKQGARWRYRINLQATDPEPDDIIEIQSNLLVTSTISFKLTNWEKAQSTFKARFTSDSAHQFSVEPKEGTLSSYGGKGTNFFVSYTPVEYGKDKRGKLIIQTPDMFWSYVLKGSLPKYIPPSNPSKSRVSTLKK